MLIRNANYGYYIRQRTLLECTELISMMLTSACDSIYNWGISHFLCLKSFWLLVHVSGDTPEEGWHDISTTNNLLIVHLTFQCLKDSSKLVEIAALWKGKCFVTSFQATCFLPWIESPLIHVHTSSATGSQDFVAFCMIWYI